MFQRLIGYWTSQMIYVAAKLGIADRLAAGPRSAAQLAAETGSHPPSLYRLLRTLAGQGIFRETSPQVFELTPLGACLQAEAEGSIRDLAILYGEETYQAWGRLLDSVQTGRTAFDEVFGCEIFEYLARNPAQQEVFNRAMSNRGVRIAEAVVAAYDFSSSAQVVDVGGGEGTLIVAILKANRGTRGLLFDLPGVAEAAERKLQGAGLQDRCRFVGGDFFETVPAGGDTYILSRILHDWDDRRSVTILQNCRRAMPQEGKVLVVEEVIPPGNQPGFSKLIDIHMLVLTGGRERTEAEFADLFAAAGLCFHRAIPTSSGMYILEAIPRGK